MEHLPVMASEVVHYLLHDRTELVFDATVGGGGHSRAILEASPLVRVIGVDTDAGALRIAQERLAAYGARVRLERASYTEVARIAGETGSFDGVLLDLGVSSFHLDDAARGFSYIKDGPLDMRMSGSGETAAHLIERSTEKELASILMRYGEVTGASRIARFVKRASAGGALESTGDLVEAVRSAIGGRPAPGMLSRVFQAVRIAVNHELDNIQSFLGSILRCVKAEARLVFVAYHSLEDREIKEFLKRESTDCVCPPGVPVCACGHRASLSLLTRRAVKPTAAEISLNPRARSARLRAARVLV